jgi:1-deoxyxylulose-5-phosphate synthase
VLLHCMTGGDWNRRRKGAMRALTEAKDEGLIRTVGVSCHSLDALETAAEEPWVEVLLARINHAGDNMDASPAHVVPVLRTGFENGKGMIGMKVYGCGSLAGNTARALNWVLDLGTIHAVTIGPTEDGHLEENVRLVERHQSRRTA